MRQGTADALQRELSRRLDCHLFDCQSGRSPMLQARELLFRFAAGLQKGYFDTLDDLKDAKALFDE